MREIYSGVPYIENIQRYADDVFSFFLHCYHIKDWIAELNKLGITKKDIDRFIKQHEELKICGDLCNGTKHCQLSKDKPSWTGEQPHIISESFHSSGNNDILFKTKCKFQVLSMGKLYDALELAEKCMSLWDKYVEEINDRYKILKENHNL